MRVCSFRSARRERGDVRGMGGANATRTRVVQQAPSSWEGCAGGGVRACGRGGARTRVCFRRVPSPLAPRRLSSSHLAPSFIFSLLARLFLLLAAQAQDSARPPRARPPSPHRGSPLPGNPRSTPRRGPGPRPRFHSLCLKEEARRPPLTQSSFSSSLPFLDGAGALGARRRAATGAGESTRSNVAGNGGFRGGGEGGRDRGASLFSAVSFLLARSPPAPPHALLRPSPVHHPPR